MFVIAGQLDGGLTRANVILAARSVDINNPLQLPGMIEHTNGNKDSYFTEGGLFQQFDVAKQSHMSKSERSTTSTASPRTASSTRPKATATGTDRAYFSRSD